MASKAEEKAAKMIIAKMDSETDRPFGLWFVGWLTVLFQYTFSFVSIPLWLPS